MEEASSPSSRRSAEERFEVLNLTLRRNSAAVASEKVQRAEGTVSGVTTALVALKIHIGQVRCIVKHGPACGPGRMDSGAMTAAVELASFRLEMGLTTDAAPLHITLMLRRNRGKEGP